MNEVRVRYIVDDVDTAASFYVEHFGFEIEMKPGPGFAMLARGPVLLMLNAPGAGGAGQSTDDGLVPKPGGWNRMQFLVEDLDEVFDRLKRGGVKFRAKLIEGRGGRQSLVEDPSGNLIELFEPPGQSKDNNGSG